jgi:DNA-directed RNA polymerase subunit RPC12/RpoP
MMKVLYKCLNCKKEVVLSITENYEDVQERIKQGYKLVPPPSLPCSACGGKIIPK